MSEPNLPCDGQGPPPTTKVIESWGGETAFSETAGDGAIILERIPIGAVRSFAKQEKFEELNHCASLAEGNVIGEPPPPRQ